MKKLYQNPMIDCIGLKQEDILTASLDVVNDDGDWILNWSDIKIK